MLESVGIMKCADVRFLCEHIWIEWPDVILWLSDQMSSFVCNLFNVDGCIGVDNICDVIKKTKNG